MDKANVSIKKYFSKQTYENARNLRFRFILCMQSFLIQFLKINGKQKIPLLLESEEFSIIKFREWVIVQIT